MILAILLTLVANPPPVPATLEAGNSYHFSADALTSAEYLQLRADGRFVLVDAQHMLTAVGDEGKWRVEGPSLILESEHRVRHVEAGDFTVHVPGFCGRDTLPVLRASLQDLRNRRLPIRERDLEKLNSRQPCSPSIHYYAFDYPSRPFSAKRLEAVIAAIDSWLADPEAQRIFEYRAWDYRGERFLVPMRAGMEAVSLGADEVRAQMDEHSGQRATYVYYWIPAEEFAKAANCTYAFKFHKELNIACNAPPAAEPKASTYGDGADPAGN